MRILKGLFIGALLLGLSFASTVQAAGIKGSDWAAIATPAAGDRLLGIDATATTSGSFTLTSLFAGVPVAVNVAAGDTSAGDDCALGYTAGEGAILTGQGSTSDITLKNDADADVLVVPTGTTNVDIVGVATAATFEPDGDTAAGDNSAIGYTAAEGAVLTGQGSTNDVTIKNDADAEVAGVPTGTTNLSMPAGTLIVADGGTVTQITSRATGVTLSTYSGQITTDATSLAAGAEATFTVTNTVVTALDTIIVNAASGQTAETSVPIVTAVGAGSYDITLTNLHASTADTGAMVINVLVLRGASS